MEPGEERSVYRNSINIFVSSNGSRKDESLTSRSWSLRCTLAPVRLRSTLVVAALYRIVVSSSENPYNLVSRFVGAVCCHTFVPLCIYLSVCTALRCMLWMQQGSIPLGLAFSIAVGANTVKERWSLQPSFSPPVTPLQQAHASKRPLFSSPLSATACCAMASTLLSNNSVL